MSTNVHKVFVSFHHENDEEYRKKFEDILSRNGVAVIRSVQNADIDPYNKTETIRQKIRDDYISDSTVTVVLIGKDTWKRKYVDWEIGHSIRDTQKNPRNGLVGILLPSHPSYNEKNISACIIPPRLYDNLISNPKFGDIYRWTEDPITIQKWIDYAFNKRKTIIPNNSRDSFKNNHSGDRWC